MGDMLQLLILIINCIQSETAKLNHHQHNLFPLDYDIKKNDKLS